MDVNLGARPACGACFGGWLGQKHWKAAASQNLKRETPMGEFTKAWGVGQPSRKFKSNSWTFIECWMGRNMSKPVFFFKYHLNEGR